MPAVTQRILASLDDPGALEALYHRDPESFREAFPAVVGAAPDSGVIRAWQARLDYREPSGAASAGRLGRAIGIGLALGAAVRVPAIWLGEEWYYPRMAPSLVLLALAAYFWFEHRRPLLLAAGCGLAVVAAVFTSLLPGTTEPPDSVVMALIHLPVVFWAFLGLVVTGDSWREAEPRLRFLRYNGELLILTSLVGLGGIVFSGITVALFQLVAENPEEWYFPNVGLVGAVAAPVVATYLYDVVFKRHTGIASVLARVFAPLFLVMTTAYLVVALIGGQNPFVDRSFLIILNGLLAVVLGMTVFSIVERGERAAVGWVDHINVALLVVTIVIDLIALAAILFRLTSYGLTPNRIVVLGANLVVLTHLAWTCTAYVGLLRHRRAAADVQHAVAGYLPVYAGWAVLVAFVLPFIFRFS